MKIVKKTSSQKLGRCAAAVYAMVSVLDDIKKTYFFCSYFLGPKSFFGQKSILGQKVYWVKKVFRSKRFLGLKSFFGVKKVFGSKSF